MIKLHKTGFIVCLFQAFFIMSCQNKIEETDKLSIVLESSLDNPTLAITNHGVEIALITIKINEKCFATMNNVVEAIHVSPNEFPDESLQRKAWRFVVDHYDYQIPFSAEYFARKPLIMLNSIGSGFAGDHAYLLYKVWRSLGFEARIWELNGHDIAEVKSDKGWEMYDSAYKIYYLNEEGDVAGVRELINNTTLITNPKLQYIPLYPVNFLEMYSFVFRHSTRLAEIYGTTEDNVKTTWLKEINTYDQIYFNLPSKGELSFPIKNEVEIKLHNEYGHNKIYSNFLKLSLREPWEGELSQPLLLAAVAGKGVMEIDSTEIRLELNPKKIVADDLIQFPQQLKINNDQSNVELYYLINEHIFNLNTKNLIEIEGSNVEGLQVELRSPESNMIEKDTSLLQLYSEFKSAPEILIFYERNKSILLNKMFNTNKVIKSINDVKANFELFFEMDSLSHLENHDRTQRVFYEGMEEILIELNDDDEQKFFVFISELRFFAVMIQVAFYTEKSFFKDYILGIYKNSRL